LAERLDARLETRDTLVPSLAMRQRGPADSASRLIQINGFRPALSQNVAMWVDRGGPSTILRVPAWRWGDRRL